jgi:hypothetical protein
MADYTIPSTPVTGDIDSYDLPQYVGELHDLQPQNTPFLSMAGGLNGVRVEASREFTWQVEDGEASSAGNTVLENAAPTASAVPRQQVKNVVEIHQEAVEFGYTAQAVVAQLATDSARIEGSNPVRNPFQHQIDKKLGKIGRDVEKSFLSGSLVNPSDNLTARETQGILGAITTHTIAYDTGIGGKGSAYTSIRECLNDLLIGMFEPTEDANVAPAVNEDGTLVLMLGGAPKVAISGEYSGDLSLTERSRTVGGVNIGNIVTDFGDIGLVMNRYMPAGTFGLFDMSVVRSVVVPIPNKGVFFAEPLAKDGATDKVQIYGEIGLEYGPESFHGTITGWS